MEPKDELDVSAMFQKMGSKLGWFQYKDMDSALHTVCFIMNMVKLQLTQCQL